MFFNRITGFLFAGILLFTVNSQAQISQGGTPMKTTALKSSRNRVVEMPPINNFLVSEGETKTQKS